MSLVSNFVGWKCFSLNVNSKNTLVLCKSEHLVQNSRATSMQAGQSFTFRVCRSVAYCDWNQGIVGGWTGFLQLWKIKFQIITFEKIYVDEKNSSMLDTASICTNVNGNKASCVAIGSGGSRRLQGLPKTLEWNFIFVIVQINCRCWALMYINEDNITYIVWRGYYKSRNCWSIFPLPFLISSK